VGGSFCNYPEILPSHTHTKLSSDRVSQPVLHVPACPACDSSNALGRSVAAQSWCSKTDLSCCRSRKPPAVTPLCLLRRAERRRTGAPTCERYSEQRKVRHAALRCGCRSQAARPCRAQQRAAQAEQRKAEAERLQADEQRRQAKEAAQEAERRRAASASEVRAPAPCAAAAGHCCRADQRLLPTRAL
jgi:hypothetical protein